MKRVLPAISIVLTCCANAAGPSGPSGTSSSAESIAASSASVGGGTDASSGSASVGGADHGTGGDGATVAGTGGSGGGGDAGGSGGTDGIPDPGPTIILSGLGKAGLLECDASRVYWVNEEDGNVLRANHDGSDIGILSPASATGATQSELRGAYLYYLVAASGTAVVKIPTNRGQGTAPLLAPAILGFTVHGDQIYWFDADGVHGPSGVIHETTRTINDIAVDESGVYILFASTVEVVPPAGGVARVLARDGNSTKNSMYLDTGYVVWGDNENVQRVTKGVGFAESIAESEATLLRFVDGTYAWMTDREVAAKMPGDAEYRAIAPHNGAGGIAVCNGYAFWISKRDEIMVRAAL